MTTTAPPVDVAFIELCRGLKNLNYTHTFGLESFDLVNTLFNDVQSLHHQVHESDEREKKIQREMDDAKLQVTPLRRENIRLIESNNEAHKKLLESAEKMDKIQKECNECVEQTKSDAMKYKHLFNTQSFRLKSQENDIVRLKAQLNALLDRADVYQHHQEINHTSKPWTGPKQTIELLHTQASEGDAERNSSFVSDTSGTASVTTCSDISPSSCDHAELVDIANSKIFALSAQIENTEKQNLSLQNNVDELMSRIENKETEIKRLAKLIDDETASKISVSHEEKISQEQKIIQLNTQIDFLTAEMIRLEKEADCHKQVDALLEKLRSQRDIARTDVKKFKDTIHKLEEKLQCVKKQCNDLTAEKTDNIKSATKKAPKTVRELEAVRVENKKLQQTIEKLNTEIAKNQTEFGQVRELYDSYQHDKSTLTSLLEKAESNTNKSRQKSIQLQSDLEAEIEAKHDTQEEVKRLKTQISSLESELSLAHESIATLNKRVATLHESARNSQSRSEQSQTQVDTLASDNSHLKQQLSQTLMENSNLRTRCETSSQQNFDESRVSSQLRLDQSRFQDGLNELAKERDEYREEMRELSETLKKQRVAVSTAEFHAEELKRSSNQVQTDLERAVRERDELIRERDEALQERTSACSELVMSRALVDELTARVTSLQRQRDNSDQSYNEQADASVRITALEREIAQREHRSSERDLELKQCEQRLHQVLQQRESLTEAMRQFDKDLVNIQSQVRAITEEREHYKFLLEQAQAELNIRSVNAKLHETASESLDDVVRDLHTKIANSELKCQQAVSNEQSARQSVERLQSALSRVESERDDSQRQITHNIAVKHKLENSKSQLNAQLNVGDRERSALRTQLEHSQRAEQSLRDQLKQTQDSLKHTTLLHTQVESRMHEMMSARSSSDQRVKDMECSLTEAHNALEDARLRAQQLDSIVQTHENALQKLDAQRDRVQSALDDKSELVAQLRSQISEHSVAMSEAQQATAALQNQMHSLNAHLQQQHNELEAVQTGAAEQRASNNSLHAQLQLKSSELDALSSDLTNMAKENQFLNGELSVAVQERDSLCQERDALAARVDYSAENVRVIQREHEDVLANYRLLSDENSRFKSAISALETRLSDRELELMTSETSLNVEHQKAEAFQTQNTSLQNDLIDIERQNEALTRSLASAQHSIDEQRESHDKLIGKITSSRATSVSLQHDRDALQQRLARDATLTTRLTETIDEMRTELDRCRKRFSEQQQRVDDLESLLAAERVNAHTRISNTNDDDDDDEALIMSKQSEDTITKLQHEVRQLKMHIRNYEHELSHKGLRENSSIKYSELDENDSTKDTPNNDFDALGPLNF